MKPAPFEYVRARTLDDALAALDADSKILAGGQSLVPMLNMRLVRPARLVDINAVPGLDDVRARPDGGLDIAPTPFQMLRTEPPTTIIATLPYIWLPGFLVPLALSLHVASLRTLGVGRAPAKERR